MTNAIVPTAVNDNLPAMNSQFESGLEELDAGDLIIPRLTITQPTTPDISTDLVGKFAVNLTGDFHDSLDLVLIKLGKSRILFPEKYKRDNDPLCRSHNFVTPANDIPGAVPMAESCGLIPGDPKKHVCPYANWTQDDKGNQSAPRCQECWNMLVVDLESYMPMWFSLKSTALKPLRKIVSAISIISQAKRQPMWAMKFSVALNKTANDSGTFYVPVFSSPTALSPEEVEAMTQIRAQLAGVEIKDAVETMNDDRAAVPEEEGKF